MKKLNVLRAAALVLFVSIFTSCSSDNNDPVNNTPNASEAYFTYKLNGQDVALTTNVAVRSGELVAVNGSTANGSSISIEFNQTGNLSSVVSLNVTGNNASFKNNFEYNIKQYFDFNLISLENGWVKGTYSGKVYDDSSDLTSEFSQVEGTFYLPYTEQAETFPISFSAKINGNNWYYSTLAQYSGSDGYSLDYTSDDEYSFNISVEPDLVDVGTYTFNSDSNRKVTLLKYNTEDEFTEEYVSSAGTLQITSATVSGAYVVFAGTFNFTATNPDTGAIVTVTNAQFKGYYDTL